MIYTSGTTGSPKGVTYTHRNVIWTMESIGRLAGRELLDGGRVISYLPLAHAAERVNSHWGPLWHCVAGGATGTVRYCPDSTQLMRYMLATRPTVFLSVPRVWEKLHAAIHAGAAAEPDERRRATVLRALEVARQVAGMRHHGEAVPEELDAAHARFAPIYADIRAKLGLDQCRWAITGAAPTPLDIELFFAGIGLPLAETWGMSELTGPATAVSPHDIRVGTCGAVLPGVEARLLEDGELLVRGGSVMAGYHRAPEHTAQTIDSGGWLHTGDIAQVDADGYYRIVDRKKELIITSSGKNIAPVQVEAQLIRHPLVGQALAVGEGRSHLTAVLVLDPEVAPAWARGRGIVAAGSGDLAAHPEVVEAVRAAVADANAHLSRIEQVKRFILVGEEWTAESGALTPTLKLRRSVVLDHYADAIARMYANPPGGIAVADHPDSTPDAALVPATAPMIAVARAGRH